MDNLRNKLIDIIKHPEQGCFRKLLLKTVTSVCYHLYSYAV